MSKNPLVMTLAAVGAICIILAILFFAGVSMGPLTSVLHSGKVVSGAHDKRGIVAAVVGLLALGGAWFANKRASASTPAS